MATIIGPFTGIAGSEASQLGKFVLGDASQSGGGSISVLSAGLIGNGTNVLVLRGNSANTLELVGQTGN